MCAYGFRVIRGILLCLNVCFVRWSPRKTSGMVTGAFVIIVATLVLGGGCAHQASGTAPSVEEALKHRQGS